MTNNNLKLPRGKNIPVDVTHKKLMREIADSSGYNLYEVEEVMLHFIAAMQRNMRQHNTVQLHCLGKFRVSTKTIPSRFSAIAKRVLPERNEAVMRFVAAQEMKRLVKFEKDTDVNPDQSE